MAMQLDTGVPVLILQLNELALPADDFAVKAEVPVRTRTLTDGRVQYYLLTQTHCTLTVTGRIPEKESAGTCCALQNEMHAHTAFSFVFAGASFDGMQITALSLNTHKNRMLTEFSVTLTGTMTEVTEA
ncbi:MAG: hypothetical protein IJ060_12300 [Oscillospiraceae bacterium]|nr:hypothetical protein [Oscillospiraceae bacterium]